MKTEASRRQLAEMAAEIFELSNLGSVARARARPAGSGEELQITETEFLALDALTKSGPLTVGEIQKRVGVLPAQMSRVIRSLESKADAPFVECSINPKDRRKIDVAITAPGAAAHRAYPHSRLSMTMEVLSGLRPEDRDEFIRILRTIRMHVDKRIRSK